MLPLCTSTASKVSMIVRSLLYGFGAIISVYFTIRFLMARIEKTAKNCMYYWTLVLALLIAMSFILAVLSRIAYCTDSTFYEITYLLSQFPSLLQYLLLIVLLFYRLVLVFQGSALEISNRITYAFFILYSFLVLIGIAYVVIFVSVDDPALSSTLKAITAGAGMAMFAALLIFSFGLFFHKLFRVMRYTADDGMNALAVKTLILSITSLATSFLNGILYVFYHIAWNEIGVMIVALGVTFDLLTNLLSMVLGYTVFDSSYTKMYGKFEVKCMSFLSRCNKPLHDLHRITSSQTLAGRPGPKVEDIDVAANASVRSNSSGTELTETQLSI